MTEEEAFYILDPLSLLSSAGWPALT